MWRATLALNLDARIRVLTRLAAADMIEARWGRIVMIGFNGEPEVGVARHGGGPAPRRRACSRLVRSAAQDLGPYGRYGQRRGARLGSRRIHGRAGRRAGGSPARGISVETVWARAGSLATQPAARWSPATLQELSTFLVSDFSSGISGAAVTVALGGTW